MEQILTSLLGSGALAVVLGFIVNYAIKKFDKNQDELEKLKQKDMEQEKEIALLKQQIEFLKK